MSLVTDLLRTRRGGTRKDEALTNIFQKQLGSFGVHNVFNPSFYLDKEVEIFSFRAIVSGQRKLSSFLSVKGGSGQWVKNISSDFEKELQVPRLIDPKLAKIGDAIYLTFNTGWVPSGNDIYIMKIYPNLESPKRLVYGNRQKQERNWAFFSEQGETFVLYQVSPLKLLKVSCMGPTDWTLEDYYVAEDQHEQLPRDFTIGTQLSKADGAYYFVGHKKYRYKGKKIYLGRAAALDFSGRRVRASKHWLVHSWRSLLGSETKHNSNLFSCTYFSGLQASGDCIRMGYGINDVDYGFSKYRIRELF